MADKINRFSDVQRMLNDISVAVADARNSALNGDYDLAAEAAQRVRESAQDIERVSLNAITLLLWAKTIRVAGASDIETEIVAQEMATALRIPKQAAKSWMTDPELMRGGLGAMAGA